MTLPFPSLNHVHLIGKLDRQPQVEADGKRRITTLAVMTMDDDADRTHRVVVYEEMLVQPIFDALVVGSIVQVIGQLDFDEKGTFVSVPARRGCDLQLLAPAIEGDARAASSTERRAQPIVVRQDVPPKAAGAAAQQSTGATPQAQGQDAGSAAAQSGQSRPGPSHTAPTSSSPPTRPAPGGRPGGLAAVAGAASPSNDDDIHDDGRDPPDSSDDATSGATRPEQAASQVSRPGSGLAGVASAARPGSPPPRPAPGGPRPAPAAPPPVNGVARPAPPARPGAARPGSPAPVNRPTVPPEFADDIPF